MFYVLQEEVRVNVKGMPVDVMHNRGVTTEEGDARAWVRRNPRKRTYQPWEGMPVDPAAAPTVEGTPV